MYPSKPPHLSCYVLFRRFHNQSVLGLVKSDHVNTPWVGSIKFNIDLKIGLERLGGRLHVNLALYVRISRNYSCIAVVVLNQLQQAKFRGIFECEPGGVLRIHTQACLCRVWFLLSINDFHRIKSKTSTNKLIIQIDNRVDNKDPTDHDRC